MPKQCGEIEIPNGYTVIHPGEHYNNCWRISWLGSSWSEPEFIRLACVRGNDGVLTCRKIEDSVRNEW